MSDARNEELLLQRIAVLEEQYRLTHEARLAAEQRLDDQTEHPHVSLIHKV